MKQNLSKLVRLNRKKGFTMVEIIIVLVIIAILAAALIPQMIGFVEDAREKTVVAEARVVYVAAQAIATEYYATTGNVADNITTITKRTAAKDEPEVVKFNSLVSDVTGGGATIGDIEIAGNGKVTSVRYAGSNGKIIMLTPGDEDSNYIVLGKIDEAVGGSGS